MTISKRSMGCIRGVLQVASNRISSSSTAIKKLFECEIFLYITHFKIQELHVLGGHTFIPNLCKARATAFDWLPSSSITITLELGCMQEKITLFVFFNQFYFSKT
jgi:hypothetical protein